MLVISLISIPFCLVLIGYFTIWAMSIIGIIEGIIYLTKSDEAFDYTYIQGHKEWF